MATTMRDLEQRLDAVDQGMSAIESRLSLLEDQLDADTLRRVADERQGTVAPVSEAGSYGLDPDRARDLLERVERLEKVSALGSPSALLEFEQEERDRRLLACNPISYQEAVAQEAARERQRKREEARQRDAGSPDEAEGSEDTDRGSDDAQPDNQAGVRRPQAGVPEARQPAGDPGA